MLIGYPRTSTIEQEAGLLARRRDVSARGCGEIQRQGWSPQSNAIFAQNSTFIETTSEVIALLS